MMWRMAERGQSAMLTALDPTNRSLATWFDNVHQPESNDGAHTARFLREFFEFLIENPQHAIVDLGAGDTALQRTIGDVGGLQSALEEKLGLVACYFLTPRVDDLGILQTIERTGFQPRATLLILNTGRADPTRPLDEQFTMITRHSIFRAAVDRGAAVLWMPALDSGVMQEVEAKRLDFGMARDELVPAGAAFPPVGGLRRHMVTNWLAQMETAFAPVARVAAMNDMTQPRRSFRAHVQAVQTELADSAVRTGLANDVYGRIIEAQSATLGVFPDFVDEVRSATPQILDHHVDRMSNAMVQAFSPSVADALRMLETKMLAWVLTAAIALFAAGGLFGWYVFGAQSADMYCRLVPAGSLQPQQVPAQPEHATHR